MKSFAEFVELLLVRFVDRHVLLRRLCIEGLLERGDREACSTARTKEASHVSAK
jgi:hypothetical protein